MITKTKRVLLLTTMTAALGYGLWWATGGNILLAAAAPAYSIWWCLTVPPYYRKISPTAESAAWDPLAAATKDPRWISKISLGLLLAIPLFGAGMSSAIFMAIYVWPWSPPGLAQNVMQTLIVSLPFSTAVSAAYIGWELNDIANAWATRKPATN